LTVHDILYKFDNTQKNRISLFNDADVPNGMMMMMMTTEEM